MAVTEGLPAELMMFTDHHYLCREQRWYCVSRRPSVCVCVCVSAELRLHAALVLVVHCIQCCFVLFAQLDTTTSDTFYSTAFSRFRFKLCLLGWRLNTIVQSYWLAVIPCSRRPHHHLNCHDLRRPLICCSRPQSLEPAAVIYTCDLQNCCTHFTAHRLWGTLSRWGLNPIKLAYNPSRLDVRLR